MVNITIRDIPDEIYERFNKLAEREGRSLNAEIIVAMEWLMAQDALHQQRTQALQRIITRRRQIPPTDVDSVELLREDRAK